MALKFRDHLIDTLKDPKEAEAFLAVALEENDPATFLELLRTLAQANGGMTVIAKRTKLHRVALYKMLAKNANPSFRNILNIITALGFQVKMAKSGSKPVRPVHRLAA
jgi:probable addiction module antidote protein